MAVTVSGAGCSVAVSSTSWSVAAPVGTGSLTVASQAHAVGATSQAASLDVAGVSQAVTVTSGTMDIPSNYGLITWDGIKLTVS